MTGITQYMSHNYPGWWTSLVSQLHMERELEANRCVSSLRQSGTAACETNNCKSLYCEWAPIAYQQISAAGPPPPSHPDVSY